MGGIGGENEEVGHFAERAEFGGEIRIGAQGWDGLAVRIADEGERTVVVDDHWRVA